MVKPLMPPVMKQAGPLLAVGLARQHPFEKPQDIPAQWMQFMSSLYPNIPNKLGEPPIGLSGGMDDDGNFEYICAAGVSAFDATPKGLLEITIQPHRYAVFAHDGHVSAIAATYSAIWNDWMPSSGEMPAESLCIERHRSTFDPTTGMGGVDIWIPLKAK